MTKRSSKRKSAPAAASGVASMQGQLDVLMARVSALEDEKRALAAELAAVRADCARILREKDVDVARRIKEKDDGWRTLNRKFLDRIQELNAMLPVCVTPPEPLVAPKLDPHSPVTPERDADRDADRDAGPGDETAAARALDQAVETAGQMAAPAAPETVGAAAAEAGAETKNAAKDCAKKAVEVVRELPVPGIAKQITPVNEVANVGAGSSSFVLRLVEEIKKRIFVFVDALAAFFARLFSWRSPSATAQIQLAA